MEFGLCAVYLLYENDKLAGERIYNDRDTVLRQLGIFRKPDRGLGRVLTTITHRYPFPALCGAQFVAEGKTLPNGSAGTCGPSHYGARL